MGLSSGRKGRGGKNIFQTQALQIACTHLSFCLQAEMKLVDLRPGEKEEKEEGMMSGTVDLTVVLSVLLINYK